MVNPEKLKKAELIDELAKHGVPLPTPTSKHLKAVFVDLYKTHIANMQNNAVISGTTDSNDDIDLDALSDDEIKNMLELRGISVGPVLASTRQVYIKKLQKLMKEDDSNQQFKVKQEEEILPVVMLQSAEIPVATRETRSASRRRTMLLSSEPPVIDIGGNQKNIDMDIDKPIQNGHNGDFNREATPVKSSVDDHSNRQRSVSVEPTIPSIENQESIRRSISVENDHGIRQRSVKPETIEEVSVAENSMITEPEQEISMANAKLETKEAKCSVYLKLSIAVVIIVLVILCLQMNLESKDIQHLLKQLAIHK